MASKFAVGDKVDQAFSNHAEGTIVAISRTRQALADMPLNCQANAQYRLQVKAA